jgi:hypothetical protein
MLHAVFFAESTVLLARISITEFATQQPEHCGEGTRKPKMSLESLRLEQRYEVKIGSTWLLFGLIGVSKLHTLGIIYVSMNKIQYSSSLSCLVNYSDKKVLSSNKM